MPLNPFYQQLRVQLGGLPVPSRVDISQTVRPLTVPTFWSHTRKSNYFIHSLPLGWMAGMVPKGHDFGVELSFTQLLKGSLTAQHDEQSQIWGSQLELVCMEIFQFRLIVVSNTSLIICTVSPLFQESESKYKHLCVACLIEGVCSERSAVQRIIP